MARAWRISDTDIAFRDDSGVVAFEFGSSESNSWIRSMPSLTLFAPMSSWASAEPPNRPTDETAINAASEKNRREIIGHQLSSKVAIEQTSSV
jgi:hypothetical protein